MADQAARNIQYEYKANSNLVLQVSKILKLKSKPTNIIF